MIHREITIMSISPGVSTEHMTAFSSENHSTAGLHGHTLMSGIPPLIQIRISETMESPPRDGDRPIARDQFNMILPLMESESARQGTLYILLRVRPTP